MGVPAGIFQSGEKALSRPPKRQNTAAASSANAADIVASPMQATVVKVPVSPGDSVVKGDLVCVLEAMKMEQPLQAHKDGVIASVECVIGDTVTSGQVLLTYESS